MMKTRTVENLKYEEQLPFIDAMFKSFSDIQVLSRAIKFPVSFYYFDDGTGLEEALDFLSLNSTQLYPIVIFQTESQIGESFPEVAYFDDDSNRYLCVECKSFETNVFRTVLYVVLSIYYLHVGVFSTHDYLDLYHAFLYFDSRFNQCMNGKNKFTLKVLLHRDGMKQFNYYFRDRRTVMFSSKLATVKEETSKSDMKVAVPDEMPLFTDEEMKQMALFNSKVLEVCRSKSIRTAKEILDEETKVGGLLVQGSDEGGSKRARNE